MQEDIIKGYKGGMVQKEGIIKGRDDAGDVIKRGMMQEDIIMGRDGA